MKKLVFVLSLMVIASMFLGGCTAKQAMLNKKLSPEIEKRIKEDSQLGELLDKIEWERGVLIYVCKKDSKVGTMGAYQMSRRIVEECMLPVHQEAESQPGTLRANVVAYEASKVDQVSGTGEYKTLASATYTIETDKWDLKRYGMSGE